MWISDQFYLTDLTPFVDPDNDYTWQGDNNEYPRDTVEYVPQFGLRVLINYLKAKRVTETANQFVYAELCAAKLSYERADYYAHSSWLQGDSIAKDAMLEYHLHIKLAWEFQALFGTNLPIYEIIHAY